MSGCVDLERVSLLVRVALLAFTGQGLCLHNSVTECVLYVLPLPHRLLGLAECVHFCESSPVCKVCSPYIAGGLPRGVQLNTRIVMFRLVSWRSVSLL